MSEFDEWAKRFEARTVVEYGKSGRKEVVVPESCMAAVREGPHKRACQRIAKARSGGYPVCGKHRGRDICKDWRGYVEGA